MITIHCRDRHQNGGKCGCEVATIRNGVLVVKLRHNGEDHVAVLTLADIVRLIEEDKQKCDPALR